jgi:hypothetical protein
MHWEITAWKSQSAFSILMSMHFDAVIMVVCLQPPLCFEPADIFSVISITFGQDHPAARVNKSRRY